MIKKLLSAAFFAAVALSATAYEVNDYAYTKVKKFRITGANLVTNGQFNQGTTGTDGWIQVADQPLEATFTMGVGGPNGSNTQKVIDGSTSMNHGALHVVAETMPVGVMPASVWKATTASWVRGPK